MAYQVSRPADETDRTLWMGDLNPSWDAAFIEEAFARMGEEVSNVKIVFDKHANKQAGYCFVEFADRDAARRAMLHINGKMIPKSKPSAAFNLSFANSPSVPYTEYNLFVNNVPQDMDDAALFLIFGERYESCRGAKVYRNADGTSKGLGFVRFSDQTDQQRALLEMNKYRVDGKQLILKLAQPKYRAPRQPRQQQQQQQQHQPHQQQMPTYESPNYNARPQEPPMPTGPYYTSNIAPTVPTAASHYVQPYAYAPVEHRPIQQTHTYYSSPNTTGTVASTCGGGALEPIALDTLEEHNKLFLETSEEFYEALEQCRWSKVVFDATTTEGDLLKALT